MLDEYTHKFNCEYQVKDYDLDPERLLHPIYCKHSLNPNAKGKITCHYLGKPMEIIIEDKKTMVNLCEFLDGA